MSFGPPTHPPRGTHTRDPRRRPKRSSPLAPRHLGFARESDLPESRGFDRWLGYLEGGEDYYTREAKVNTASCTTTHDFWFGVPGKGRPVGKPEYYMEYSTHAYTDFLVQRIQSHDPTVPLFVYAAFQGVHYPLEVPRHYFQRYRAQGAEAGECEWARQANGSSGYPNGFECAPNVAFPHLGKRGLDCLCNRLLVKAQVGDAPNPEQLPARTTPTLHSSAKRRPGVCSQ